MPVRATRDIVAELYPFLIPGGREIMAHLLLIDDDRTSSLEQVRQAFPAPSHRVDIAGTGTAGLEHVRMRRPDVILLALHLPDQSGLEVYAKIRRMGVRNPVIFVTMARTADAAIEAMKQGAHDYLFKPLDPDQLRKVGDGALEVARRMQAPTIVAEPQPDPDAIGAILGSSPSMREVYKAIGRVAAQDVPVLITGESGTGKELVARAIYQHSSRADSSFLALELRGRPREPAGERALRPREGCIHGCRAASHRQVRAVPRRYPVARRGRRHAAGPASQGLAVVAGAGVRAGRGQ